MKDIMPDYFYVRGHYGNYLVRNEPNAVLEKTSRLTRVEVESACCDLHSSHHDEGIDRNLYNLVYSETIEKKHWHEIHDIWVKRSAIVQVDSLPERRYA